MTVTGAAATGGRWPICDGCRIPGNRTHTCTGVGRNARTPAFPPMLAPCVCSVYTDCTGYRTPNITAAGIA